MYLLVMIVGVGLLSPAQALTCYMCPAGSSATCTTTQVCPSANLRCGSLRMVTYAGGIESSDQHVKGCAIPEECTELSVNYGVSRSAVNTACCTTDRCNSQSAARPTKNSPNGKKCYQCVGTSCGTTLNCLGTEDRCITSTATIGGVTQTFKGCASKVVCDTQASSPLMKSLEKNTIVNKCCEGDLCNGAISISAGLLLLVAPLLTKLLL